MSNSECMLTKKKLNISDLREILIKNWMSHDGFWFFHCLQHCGIEKTNMINRAAVKSMSLLEIKRLKKMFELDNINNFKDLKNFINLIFQVVKANFMDFEYFFPKENVMIFRMNTCFAHDGVKRIGALEEYKCGIFLRIDCWLEGLNLDYDTNPENIGCLLRDNGKCEREYLFNFK
ncbi:MAG: hypothetical protein GF317_08055 [Candidatus Lokiarchaeota archaeon]|nr:hypothetical protein [Candidatus Lokiarchaeota archaeon]MBD3199666.1 hypothetical protein [Candidatus Lokiarchaeota archaeon]